MYSKVKSEAIPYKDVEAHRYVFSEVRTSSTCQNVKLSL
jgi:hypothetical protein